MIKPFRAVNAYLKKKKKKKEEAITIWKKALKIDKYFLRSFAL